MSCRTGLDDLVVTMWQFAYISGGVYKLHPWLCLPPELGAIYNCIFFCWFN